MKLPALLLFIMLCIGCSDNEPTASAQAPASTSESTSKKDNTKEGSAETSADLSGPVKATLDMGNYTFRVHNITHYHPSDMQARMMKWDDNKKDFYILDCSVENKTGESIDVGKNSLAVYYSLSDGTTYANTLRGASLLASYNVDNKQRYPQSQYDLIFGKKIPANGKARCNLYGVEAPEGASITGIGFYRNNKAKNKFTEIAQ